MKGEVRRRVIEAGEREATHREPLVLLNLDSFTFVWRVACGVWRVACGVWRVACGVWRVACGVWRVACFFGACTCVALRVLRMLRSLCYVCVRDMWEGAYMFGSLAYLGSFSLRSQVITAGSFSDSVSDPVSVSRAIFAEFD
jgi:hypothetical protein